MANASSPFVLIILDGFGYREEASYNAIASADTPHWDAMWSSCPHTLLSGSGRDVGLPSTQMGNSEVGHVNMGAGRVVYQDLTRVDKAIEEGEFAEHLTLLNACKEAKKRGTTVHIMGLLSPGGVHSHESHLQAAVSAATKAGAPHVAVHAFLDGRDTPPQSAAASLTAMEHHCAAQPSATLASMVGRYYAMDRDQRWERVKEAYDLLTDGPVDHHADNAQEALAAAYARGETDEFVKATLLSRDPKDRVRDGDVVIFMNFRSDRARELTHAFVDEEFDGFERNFKIQLTDYITLTEYEAGLPVSILYTKPELKNSLGEWVSAQGKRQLRIAETEKYAHVTFFFNGGSEREFEGESRILIQSPDVATYDLQPEMSAPELTDRLVGAIEGGEYDLIVCNYANPDMVGHTGNFEATVEAIQVIDTCLGRVKQALEMQGGQMLITADHGNADIMCDEKSGQPHTAHTHEPVPFVYVGEKTVTPSGQGALSDIAPTLLSLMGLPIPEEMTGRVLFEA